MLGHLQSEDGFLNEIPDKNSYTWIRVGQNQHADTRSVVDNVEAQKLLT